NGVVWRIPGIFGGARTNGFIYNVIQKIVSGETVPLKTAGLGYWEAMYVNDLVSLMSEFILNYNWVKPFDIFNIAYGEETDLVKTATYISNKLGRPEAIKKVGEKDYVRLYMCNDKLKSVVAVPYSYYKSLDRYMDTLL
ncbi:MAG: hypothetical protein AAF901_13660, partial [Bacteroidota bacterium]